MACHASPRTGTSTGNRLRPLPVLLILIVLTIAPSLVSSWTTTTTSPSRTLSPRTNIYTGIQTSTATAVSTPASSSWFLSESETSASTSSTPISRTLEQRKAELLQLGAALDRGQAYNPTSGSYYADRMEAAETRIANLIAAHPDNVPVTLQEQAGEWELVLTTVSHGIFRSSPFFLAIQQAYEDYAETKTSFGIPKAELFFKLHELQTCSWGVSKIGRVAQTITADTLYSEFDTSLFSLTVIPILGWFKLLPTFGGCVVTVAKAWMDAKEPGILQMQVDYTTAVPVDGLQGLGSWIWNVRVPVNAVWKLLPWNKGRDATCKVYVRFCDDDFRIVQDVSGDYFVYTRPVLSRPLELAQQEQV